MPDNILRDEVTVYSQTQNLRKVREFLSRVIRQSRLPEREQNRVVLAVDEAVANIIEHGYQSREDGIIRVIVEASDDYLKVVIEDSGVSFNPETADDVNMEKHLAAHRNRGLGIFLMRKIMDEVRYNFKEGVRNELVLVKYIHGEP